MMLYFSLWNPGIAGGDIINANKGLEVRLSNGEVEFVTWEQVYSASFGL